MYFIWRIILDQLHYWTCASRSAKVVEKWVVQLAHFKPISNYRNFFHLKQLKYSHAFRRILFKSVTHYFPQYMADSAPAIHFTLIHNYPSLPTVNTILSIWERIYSELVLYIITVISCISYPADVWVVKIPHEHSILEFPNSLITGPRISQSCCAAILVAQSRCSLSAHLLQH